MRVVNVSSGGGGGDSLSLAVEDLIGEGHDIELIDVTSEEMDSDEASFRRHLDAARGSALIIIRLHGGVPYFKKFSRFMEALQEQEVPILLHSEVPEDISDHRHLFPFTSEDHSLALSYMKLGGRGNEKGLLTWALANIGGAPVTVPSPIRPQTEGIYDPDAKGRMTDIGSLLAKHDKGKPTAGLMFHQGYWLSGNLDGVDCLISALKEKGMNVIPVFYIASPDPVSGSIGAKGAVERFLYLDGKRLVDVLVMTMGFSQLRLSTPGDGSENDGSNFFSDLDVPVLQAGFTYSSRKDWEESTQGLGTFEMSGNITWPEYDGQIITVPVAAMDPTPDGSKRLTGIPDRAGRVAGLAKAWSTMASTPVDERKVAIILYQNPPRRDAIGGAFGLDSPQSVVNLLRRLKDEGYDVDHVPENGQELVGQLLSGLANDDDWLSAEEMMERAAATIPAKTYVKWTESVPKRRLQEMCRDWGDPPGEIFTTDGSLLVPGIRNGNVFIGIQPPRGLLEKSQEMYHSTDIVIPHSYLAYYRWIKECFGAQMVVHMGTHGTLEWLPGKSMGLSQECFPDIVLGDLLNLYPYLMSNPGEGMQAKRRSCAVTVDHLPPSMCRAGDYGDLETLDIRMQSYFQSQRAGQKEKCQSMCAEVLADLRKVSLLSDLGLPDDISASDLEEHMGRLYDYLHQIKDGIIKDGLHIFGEGPKDELLEEMVYALTRLRNGETPSLREAMASLNGYHLGSLMANPSEIDMRTGKTHSTLIDGLDAECMKLISLLRESVFNADAAEELVHRKYGGNEDLSEVCRYICDHIVPSLIRTTDELESCIHCMDGGYVLPGPSGPPTRGNAHLLPSGRNFYSIDPNSIPTPAAWELGKRMADQMVERYIQENGCYPESVGMVVFATDTMKTGGDDISYILWLMGLRPQWAADGGKVVGMEVIPISELGRPRIDVTLRISGLFRDTFPHLVDLIDDGVTAVSSLDESPEKNYICKHLQEDIVKSLREGMGEKEATDRARIRIFGCPPGTYGGGVGELIESSQWSDPDDLGKAFINWGGHAYGRGRKGERVTDVLEQRLSGIDVTVKNHSSRELDMLDNDDDFVYHGGMIAAVKSTKGELPLSLVGDSSDPDRPRLRSTDEEAKFLFRSRIMNPRWLNGLMRHGYAGVQELSNMMDYTFAWDATADVIEPWMYQAMAEGFLFDKEVQDWINDNNPHAMRHMTGRLLEAIDRGMWAPENETRDKLETLYLDSDEFMEED